MKRVHICTAAMCPRFLVASGSLGQAVTAFFLLCSLVSLRYFFASTQAVKIKPKSRVP